MNITLNIESNAQLEALLDALTPDSNATLPEIEAMDAKIGGIIESLYQLSDDAHKAFRAAWKDASQFRVMQSPLSGVRVAFTTRKHAEAFWFYVADGCTTARDRLAFTAGTIEEARKGDRFTLVLGNTNARVDAILDAAFNPVELVEKRVF